MVSLADQDPFCLTELIRWMDEAFSFGRSGEHLKSN